LFVVRGIGPSNVVVGRLSDIGHVADCSPVDTGLVRVARK
jgi:hypothetical protein